MMDSVFDNHSLPPLKRLRLRFQQNYADFSASRPLPQPTKRREQTIADNTTLASSDSIATFCLPAKKRVWHPPLDFITGSPKYPSTNVTSSLPAKKRVWTPPPDPTPNHTVINTLPAKKRTWVPPAMEKKGVDTENTVSTTAVTTSLPAKSKRKMWTPSLDIIPETSDSTITITDSEITEKSDRVSSPNFIPQTPNSTTRITTSLPAKKIVRIIPPHFFPETPNSITKNKSAGVSLPGLVPETPKSPTTAIPSLPTKKRVLAPSPEHIHIQPTTTATTKSLPAQKKVSAPLLDTISENPDSTITDTYLLTRNTVRVSPPDVLPKPLCQPNPTTAITTSLPTKKRVCAPPPEFIPINSTHHFDLNVEYNPSTFHKESKKTPHPRDIQITQEQKLIETCVNEVAQVDENAAVEITDDVNNVTASEVDEDGIECAVCGSTDGDPTDPIVFCDGCDLMVHTTCYGNPLIHGVPEGDWFCAKCSTSSSLDNSSCCLCPVPGGALKPTNDGKWAHLLCALYVPEVFFEDPDGREGIDCSKVPKRRWEQGCYVCDSKNGCVIECSEPKCDLCFHVSCGLNVGLSIEYKEGRSGGGGIVAGFCKEHTELWKKQQETGKFKIVARD